MDDIPENGKCFGCGKKESSDGYCFGCKEFICSECEAGWSVASAMGWGHEPGDHFEEAVEE